MAEELSPAVPCLDAVFLPNVRVTRGEVAELRLMRALHDAKASGLAHGELRYLRLRRDKKCYCAHAVFASDRAASRGLAALRRIRKTTKLLLANPQLDSSLQPANRQAGGGPFVAEASGAVALKRDIERLRQHALAAGPPCVVHVAQIPVAVDEARVLTELRMAGVDTAPVRVDIKPNQDGCSARLWIEFADQNDCLGAVHSILEWRRRNNCVFFRAPRLFGSDEREDADRRIAGDVPDDECRLEREWGKLKELGLAADLVFVSKVGAVESEWEMSATLVAHEVRGVERVTLNSSRLWIHFSSEDACLAGARIISRLHREGHRCFLSAPRLNNQQRTMRANVARAQRRRDADADFLKRQERVEALGGKADTLLLRQVPWDTDLGNLEDAIGAMAGGVVHVRGAVDRRMECDTSAGAAEEGPRNGRMVWVRFSGREECAAGFAELAGAEVELITGESVVLRSVSLHDDSKAGREGAGAGAGAGGARRGGAAGFVPVKKCLFFANGRCPHGASCTFLHTE